jgi:hypothetical protein
MLKRKTMLLFSIVFIITSLRVSVQAQSNLLFNDVTQQLVIRPNFTYIWIFQTGFDISSTGKASVNVYLTAQNVDSVKVEASLQQYKNGTWTTIKSWSNTETGTNAGLAGTYYVAKGYSYRVVSCGSVFKSGNLVEITSYTSNSKTY